MHFKCKSIRGLHVDDKGSAKPRGSEAVGLSTHTTGCLKKKRGPFLKLVLFLYLSRNLSKILYGCGKMIILCSGEDSINSNTSTGSDVTMTSNCIYVISLFSSALLKT